MKNGYAMYMTNSLTIMVLEKLMQEYLKTIFGQACTLKY